MRSEQTYLKMQVIWLKKGAKKKVECGTKEECTAADLGKKERENYKAMKRAEDMDR